MLKSRWLLNCPSLLFMFLHLSVSLFAGPPPPALYHPQAPPPHPTPISTSSPVLHRGRYASRSRRKTVLLTYALGQGFDLKISLAMAVAHPESSHGSVGQGDNIPCVSFNVIWFLGNSFEHTWMPLSF